MPTPPITPEELQRSIDLVRKHKGNITQAANELGIARSTLQCRLRKAGVQILAPPPVLNEASPQEIRDAAFWKRKAQQETKRADDAEHISSEIAGIFRRQAAIPRWTLPEPGSSGGAVGLIHLSDLHVGEVVRPEEIGGVNEYNPEIFQRRIRRMITASIGILPRWASDCKLRGVVVALNGDLVSGDIHDELRRTNALTAHEQVYLARDELSGAIKKLVEAFGNVMVTVTPGNHGRSTEKTHAKRMAALSYDTMIGNMLAREFADDERITVNVASGADLLFNLFGWSILQTHGDSMGTGGGQGFAGPELPIVRGGKKVKLSGFAVGQRYDIIMTAHYHTSSNPGTVLANGSMVGFSEYSLRIRGVPEPPQQWLALIHSRWGLRERAAIILEDMPSRPLPRVRIPAGMR